ncbi:hypothetical protein [Gulosibacter sp.]|uniref:hypothetical protein n=1 Tax=Gulosibacter sp. TaxID=2817531 RepID=UPI003F8E95E9
MLSKRGLVCFVMLLTLGGENPYEGMLVFITVPLNPISVVVAAFGLNAGLRARMHGAHATAGITASAIGLLLSLLSVVNHPSISLHGGARVEVQPTGDHLKRGLLLSGKW